MIIVTKKHSFCYGHRVYGHRGKCQFPHGHNATICFSFTSEKLDSLGMVIDFGDIKKIFCQWIDDHFDHRFLIWDQDPLYYHMEKLEGVVRVNFNPTVENMADYVLNVVGPKLIIKSKIKADLISVRISESENNYVHVTSE